MSNYAIFGLGFIATIIVSFIYMLRREWYLNFERDDSMEEDE